MALGRWPEVTTTNRIAVWLGTFITTPGTNGPISIAARPNSVHGKGVAPPRYG